MDEDYLKRFGGIGRLYGRQELERLRAAHVAVIGVGGVGSWTVEALVRSGVGALTMIDMDDVCITNVNRQLPALDGEIGRPKVDVLADRVRAISPACAIRAVPEFFNPATSDALLDTQFSAVVDATDRLANKCLIITECLRRGFPVVTIGGAGGRRDSTGVRVGDLAESINDELLRQVRRKLRRENGLARAEGERFGVSCVYSAEKPVYPWSNGTCGTEPEPGASLRMDCASGFGAATFVTGAFGFAAAGEVVRLITR